MIYFSNREIMTKQKSNTSMFLGLFSLLLLLLLGGCVAGKASFDKGNKALNTQSYDQAVMEFLAAVESDPANHEYRLKLNNSRNRAAFLHKTKGDNLVAQQQYVQALEEYQLATELDSSMYSAFDGLKFARSHLQVQKLVNDAQVLLQTNQRAQARDLVANAIAILPNYWPALELQGKIKHSQYALVDGVELEVTSTEPIALNFRDTKLPDVFEILTKLSGINFILDEDVRNSKTTLFLEQATFAQSLELLLRMNKLDKKILNSKTIILFPKTSDKQKQFADQIIQTFYLSHIDAKKAVNLLRTMLQVRKVYVQEDLNAIVIRDQPEVIKLAHKLLEATDRGNSEVVFDLELIEVNHSDTRELGLKLSNYSIGAGLSVVDSGKIVSSSLRAGADTIGLIAPLDNLDPFYSIPTASFKFMKTLIDAEILANPKIRVRNKEKAKVHVGTREPVITVTINDTQTSENVQYIDVGVKLDVEPRIQLDKTIVTTLGLEVSNVSGREKTENGTVAITISSTTANTVLTLKDGEQTIIGGLIRNDSSVTKSMIPLLGDIPWLGELFSGTDKTDIKREILLSITPHIVRSVPLPQGDIASIWSGGEDDLKSGRNFGAFAEEYTSSVGPQGGATLSKQPAGATQLSKNTGSLDTGAGIGTTANVESPAAATNAKNKIEAAQLIEGEIVEEEVVERKQKPTFIVIGEGQVKLGDEFDLSFMVTDIENLRSAPLYIQYDPAIVDLVGTTEGSFLNRDEVATVFTHTVLKPGGRIIVGLKQGSNGSGVSGDGELFQMKFRAIAAGKTAITPSRTNFRGPQGKRILVNSVGIKIEVSP